MTDLPPEMLEKLAHSLGGWCGDCGPRDVDCDTCKRDARALAVEALHTLIAHAGPDATHIDLSTWGGVRANRKYYRWCETHAQPTFTAAVCPNGAECVAVLLFTIEPTDDPEPPCATCEGDGVLVSPAPCDDGYGDDRTERCPDCTEKEPTDD